LYHALPDQIAQILCYTSLSERPKAGSQQQKIINLSA